VRQRAVRAALDLVTAVSALGRRSSWRGAPGIGRESGRSGRRSEGRLHEALDSGAAAVWAGEATSFDHQAVKRRLVEAVEAALALGELGRIQELLSVVDAVPPGLRSPYLDAHVRRFRARMAGDEAGLAGAAASFRELDVPFWLAVTLLELAELTEHAAARDEAREIFERLGATPR
jgi:hypothetical protein